MTSRLLPPAAAAGVLTLLLAGCSPDTPAPSPTPTTATASASPTPTSSLTPAQQEAFEQATDVVLAFEQTILDLYTGARSRVNDLDNYATGELLEATRRNVSQGLAQGYRTEPEGAQVALISAEPGRIKLTKDPATIEVRTCVDHTSVTDIAPDGTRTTGNREQLTYSVVKTTHLPDPGWAVSAITGEADAEDRRC